MNQILISEKLYITPELRRKKRIHKVNLFISIFLIIVLFSYYIYAEYDRNKNEEISKEILSTIDLSKTEEAVDETQRKEDEVIIVILDENAKNSEIEKQATDLAATAEQREVERFTTENGTEYYTAGVLSIPKISITYPIIASENSDSATITELLKISLTKYWGPEPNQVGNLCIVGHNYNNKKFFGRLSELENGDTIELTDNSGQTIKYSVYDSYIVNPTNMECTSQLTDGKTEITLITCTPNGKQRLVVKARALII